MAKVIALNCSDGSIVFDLVNIVNSSPEPIFWIRLTLLTDNSVVLGANDAEYLIGHLGRWLSTIHDHERTWVLTLHEDYCSIYGERSGDTSVLSFLDKDSRPLTRLRLTAAEVQSWLDTLTELPGRLAHEHMSESL
jgi:hypothetical protein